MVFTLEEVSILKTKYFAMGFFAGIAFIAVLFCVRHLIN
jgi:hypothetical protein